MGESIIINYYLSHNTREPARKAGESEEDFFKRKEVEFNRHMEKCMSEAHKAWRISEENTHGVAGWKAAMVDFKSFCRGSSLITQINSIGDFQRIFHYNADKFLSEKARTEKDLFSGEELSEAREIAQAIYENQSQLPSYQRITSSLTYREKQELKRLLVHMKKRGYTVQDIVRLIPTYISEWVSDSGDVALIGGLTAPCGRPGYYTELTIDALIAEESKRKLDY